MVEFHDGGNLTAPKPVPTSRRNRAFPPERHSGYRRPMADPYSTLGVAKSASEAEIKSAYR
jgi:DnaJ-class molecular chaperone